MKEFVLKKVCKYCGKEIKTGEKYLDIKGNNGMNYFSHANKECYEGVVNGKTKPCKK